jgi:MFS family permease
VTRRVGLAIAAMAATQVAVYIARPMTSYRLLGVGAGAGEIGLVTAAFAILPLFLAIPLGRWADRKRLPWVTFGCGIQVIACGLLGTLHAAIGLGAASALLGLGHLGVALGVQEVIARESDDEHHDRHFGLLTAGVSLGQLVGPLVGGVIVGAATGAALVGASSHALAVAAGVAVVATVLAYASERSTRPAHAAGLEPHRGSVRGILTLPGVPAGLLASIAVLSASDVFTAYMPVLGEQRGIAPAAVGILLALRAGSTVTARLGIGWLVTRIGRSRLIGISAFAAAGGFAAMTTTSDVVLLALLTLVVGAGLGYGQPLSMTLVVQRVPMHARATALAVRLTGNRVGQVAAPAAAGLVAGNAGAGAVFWLLSGLLAVTAVAVGRGG